jgi:hypothetical protein
VDDDSLDHEEFSATLGVDGYEIQSKPAIGDYSPFRLRISKLAGLLDSLDLSEEHDFTSRLGGGWTIVNPKMADPKPVKMYEFKLVAGTKRTCRIIVLRYKPAPGAGAAGAGAGASEDDTSFADSDDDVEFHDEAHITDQLYDNS